MVGEDHVHGSAGGSKHRPPQDNNTKKEITMSFREVHARAKMSELEWIQTQQGELKKTGEDKEEANYKLHLVNGTYQIPDQEEKATNDLIRNFDTRDSDVFVCAFVASGTTWTQHIINLLLSGGEPADVDYTETVPWLESLTFPSLSDEPPELHRQAKNWTIDKLRSTPHRRFMKTHANLRDLPAGTAKGLKVVYVARNPKDVCVSLFHHARNKHKDPFAGDFSDMLSCFVKGRCENGSWFNHVLEWWEAANADPEHVLFLTYEEMLANPKGQIQTIADFVGIECTADILAKTVEGSTLSAMKRDPKANIRPDHHHLRKGGAGGWRDVFSVRESEAFDEIYCRQMNGSGLKMDFGEGLVM